MRAVPIDALRQVLALRPEIRWAYLYGSAARNEPSWQDLDVGVVATRPLLLRDLLALAGELEAAAGAAVDVKDLTGAPPIRGGARVTDKLQRILDAGWRAYRDLARYWDTLPPEKVRGDRDGSRPAHAGLGEVQERPGALLRDH